MNISVSEAKAKLTELVRRAEAGEEVVLTRNGRAVARLAPMAARPRTREEKLKLLNQLQARAAQTMTPGPTAARSQDFLYDENGLPV